MTAGMYNWQTEQQRAQMVQPPLIDRMRAERDRLHQQMLQVEEAIHELEANPGAAKVLDAIIQMNIRNPY